MMKKLVVFCMLLGLAAVYARAQNVGVNEANPQVPLHIKGAVALDSVQALPAAAAISITRRVSQVIIADDGSVTDNVITYAPTPIPGQLMYILNQDDESATFAGTAIASGRTSVFIYMDGAWRSIAGVGGSGWSLEGDAGTNHAVNFLGTTDAQDLRIRTNDTERIRVTSGGDIRMDGDFVNQSMTGSFVSIPLGGGRQRVGCARSGTGSEVFGFVANTAGTAPLVSSVSIPNDIAVGNQGVLINANVNAQPNPVMTFAVSGALYNYRVQLVRATNAALTVNRVTLGSFADANIGMAQSISMSWPSGASFTFVDDTVVAGTTYFYGIELSSLYSGLALGNLGCLEVVSAGINTTMIKR